MAAIANALSRVSAIDVEILMTLTIFCGFGLAVSLLAANLGVDLSCGFF